MVVVVLGLRAFDGAAAPIGNRVVRRGGLEFCQGQDDRRRLLLGQTLSGWSVSSSWRLWRDLCLERGAPLSAPERWAVMEDRG